MARTAAAADYDSELYQILRRNSRKAFKSFRQLCVRIRQYNDRISVLVAVRRFKVRIRNMAQAKTVKKTMSATQGAYVEIKRRILEGELAEGSPIRQDDIAVTLGVSKIPVREALMRLQSEGLVKFIPNVGAMVATLTVMDYIEMLDMRLALECRALELAVPNMASSDIAKARQLLAAYDQAMTQADWSDLNMSFHACLYAPANRPRLVTMIRSVQDHMGRMLRLRVSGAAGHTRSHNEHVQILDACEMGNTAKAVGLLRKHIEQTQREVQGSFRHSIRGKSVVSTPF